MKGLNTTDFKTSFFLNFSKIKLLLKTDEDLRSSLELGIFFKILDQVFTTVSLIFLKLLKDPNVINLLLRKK